MYLISTYSVFIIPYKYLHNKISPNKLSMKILENAKSTPEEKIKFQRYLII